MKDEAPTEAGETELLFLPSSTRPSLSTKGLRATLNCAAELGDTWATDNDFAHKRTGLLCVIADKRDVIAMGQPDEGVIVDPKGRAIVVRRELLEAVTCCR